MSQVIQKKSQVIREFSISKEDTGSPEVQVALLTNRIHNLSAHLKNNPKDLHSQRGLMIMVGRRRRILDYLKETAAERYQTLIQRLELRR